MFSHDALHTQLSAFMEGLADAAVSEMRRLLEESTAMTVQCWTTLSPHGSRRKEEDGKEQTEVTIVERIRQFNTAMTSQFASLMETLTKDALDKMVMMFTGSMADAEPSLAANVRKTSQKKARRRPGQVNGLKKILPARGSYQMRKKDEEELEQVRGKADIGQGDETPPEEQCVGSQPSFETRDCADTEFRDEDVVQGISSSHEGSPAATTAVRKKRTKMEPIKCPSCEKTFAQKCFFDRHYLSHSKPHLCSQCGKRFARPEGLVAHGRRHSGEKLYKCVECGREFAYKSTFTRHMRQHKVKKICTHTCAFCEGQFPGALALQRHKCSALGKTFSCSRCPQIFECRQSLADHENLHSGERDYVCEMCGECFFSSSSLSIHRVTHMQKDDCCNELSLDSSHSSFLQNPHSEQTQKKLFPCNVCGKGCSHLSALKHHMLTHTGERAYVCETCGKRCGHASALQNHIRIHTGQKPGQRPVCGVCGKCLSSMVKLKYHMSIHTGEKPYACNQCGRKFRNPSNLRKHHITHTGEKLYGCTICRRRFTQASSLKLHRLIHTGERPYCCAVCGKVCSHRAELKKHQMVHMPAESADAES